MNIRRKSAEDNDWLLDVLVRDWGGTSIVVHGDEIELYDAEQRSQYDGH